MSGEGGGINITPQAMNTPSYECIHWNGTWPKCPPEQFILVVVDMTVDAFSEGAILGAIKEAGYTLVDCHHSTVPDWAEYHVRRYGGR